MTSPRLAGHLDRLLTMHQEGAYADEELAYALARLMTADNVAAVLARVPPRLLDAVKRHVALDGQRAADDECLRPERSPFDSIFNRYHCAVSDALLEPQREGLLSVVCLPSFEVEWALRLLKSSGAEYSLALAVAESQIWATQSGPDGLFDQDRVTVCQSEVALPADLALPTCVAFRKMLIRARHPHPEAMQVGKDGVTYHFACHGPGIGWMAGHCWSPDPETPPGKLVALSRLLRGYVERDEKGREELAGEISQAADWFRRLAE